MRRSARAQRCAFFPCVSIPLTVGSMPSKPYSCVVVEKNGMINEGRRQHLPQVYMWREKRDQGSLIFRCLSFMLIRCSEWAENWKAVIKFPCELADLTQHDNTRTYIHTHTHGKESRSLCSGCNIGVASPAVGIMLNAKVEDGWIKQYNNEGID